MLKTTLFKTLLLLTTMLICATPAVGQESTTVGAWWMEPGNEQYLGGFPLDIDGDTLIGTFSGNVTLPGNAAPGAYPVAFMLPADTDLTCLTFTVTEPGGQPADDAPPTTVSRLPETGLNANIAAIALALAAGALATIRGRR